MAEAMALGVPTIATGYSGNMDFMNSENSWLVAYDMAPVRVGEYPEAEGQQWAEPRLDSAIALMERVWRDRERARSKAAQARRDMAVHFSPRACGLRYLERLVSLEGRSQPAA